MTRPIKPARHGLAASHVSIVRARLQHTERPLPTWLGTLSRLGRHTYHTTMLVRSVVGLTAEQGSTVIHPVGAIGEVRNKNEKQPRPELESSQI